MTHERSREGPSNIVGLNRYNNESRLRVSARHVREEWYTARLVNPEPESIEQFAADILMKVAKVAKLKDGAIKVYATPVDRDGREVDESDSVLMNRDGYFIEGGEQHGYLLDAYGRMPKELGTLAAQATIEV